MPSKRPETSGEAQRPVPSEGGTVKSPGDERGCDTIPGAQPLAERMGITITEAAPERVVGTMPVEGNTQPYGLLHGGASCVLAETLGSVAAALHAGRDKFTFGIEINATHHRAAAAGYVTGVATQVHAGKTLATYEIVISDDHGRRICTARLSCLMRDAMPGGAAGRATGGSPEPAAGRDGAGRDGARERAGTGRARAQARARAAGGGKAP